MAASCLAVSRLAVSRLAVSRLAGKGREGHVPSALGPGVGISSTGWESVNQ